MSQQHPALQALLRLAASCGGSNQAAQAAAAGDDAAAVTAAEACVRDRVQAQQHEAEDLRRREAALQAKLAEATLENVELRREVAAGWQAAEPPLLQVRSLITDPAVQREIDRLRTDLADSVAQVQQLKDRLNAAEYTPDSAAGKQITEKCHALLRENQQLSKELAEAKSDAAARQLAAARAYTSELQASLADARQRVAQLEEQQEEASMGAFVKTRRGDHDLPRQQQQQHQRGRPGGGGAGGAGPHDHRGAPMRPAPPQGPPPPGQPQLLPLPPQGPGGGGMFMHQQQHHGGGPVPIMPPGFVVPVVGIMGGGGPPGIGGGGPAMGGGLPMGGGPMGGGGGKRQR